MRERYRVDNGFCPDLPGYLIGTTPIEFTPMDIEPFDTTPLTGWLWRDGDIWFGLGGPSSSNESTWGRIKSIYR